MMEFEAKIRRVFLWTILLLSGANTYSQTQIQIDALNAKAWDLLFTEPMEARQYAIQAKDWAEKAGYLPGLGDSYSTLGYLYCSEGATEDGYQAYSESLRARRLSGDSTKVANVYINLSIFKNDEGRYDEARSNAAKAISLLENLFKKEHPKTESAKKVAYALGQAYLNLSNIYSDFHDNVLALEYARKGYRIQAAIGNQLHLARAMQTLGNRFYTAWDEKATDRNYADSAMYYYQRALDYLLLPKPADKLQIGIQEIADIYYNMSQIALDKGNYAEAWTLMGNAESKYQTLEEGAEQTTGQIYIWLSKGRWYTAYKNDYQTALDYLKKAASIDDPNIVDVGLRMELLNQLSETFAKNGQRDSAYWYQKLATGLSVSHFNDRQTRFQDEERSDWRQKLNTEISNSALVKEREKYLSVAVIALCLLALVILLLAWIATNAWRRKAKAADRKIQQILASLDSKFLEGIESEREEIAALLHDDLGGQSVANTWMLETLLEQLSPGSAQRELANRAHQSSRELSESIRSFSHRLGSVYVRRSGLVPTLKELCLDISSSGRIQANMHVEPWQPALELNQEIQLLRMLQELISNTVKYAKAKTINIYLSATDNLFEMRYSDDGTGFDVQKKIADGTGMGMVNVQRRAAVLNGQLKVGSDFGSGMWAIVQFPLQQAMPDLALE